MFEVDHKMLYEVGKPIRRQIFDTAIERANRGEIVRLVCGGETMGYMVPGAWVEGEALFAMQDDRLHISKQ